MATRKKALTFEQQFMNAIELAIYLSSDDSTLPGLQRAIIASGMTDEEIADRCDLCSRTVQRMRKCDPCESGEDYGPFLRTADEIRRALHLGVGMVYEIEPVKKAKKRPLKLVGRKK